eukprot:TRINITY_DN8131_c0_g1_i1.p1 TRINITY_DN8131_c0_g1~~TRINITY_DN8131_c0_g1_i1.p1  ORF type:complete len:264 (+),score=77.09 TRINITY_DN8131_c0_g1_i1:64-792(+)
MSTKAAERWPPIESNPDVMNRLAKEIGLTEKWSFTDVFGLDDDLLAMLPSPVIALVLLFPSSQKTPVNPEKQNVEKENSIFFLKQVDELDDACGTIAMVHALANNYNKQSNLLADNNALLKEYVEQAKASDPTQRGLSLANNKTIAKLHSSFAEQGQTQGIPEGVSSKHHFVCFTEVDGHVFELDGCKPFPINHGTFSSILEGASSPFPFLSSAARVIQREYLKDPTVLDFSIIALAANPDD